MTFNIHSQCIHTINRYGLILWGQSVWSKRDNSIILKFVDITCCIWWRHHTNSPFSLRLDGILFYLDWVKICHVKCEYHPKWVRRESQTALKQCRLTDTSDVKLPDKFQQNFLTFPARYSRCFYFVYGSLCFNLFNQLTLDLKFVMISETSSLNQIIFTVVQ